MNLQLSGPFNKALNAQIGITGSKSESNRMLILQALFPQLSIQNISNADDVRYMLRGLSLGEGEVDIHHAGTAMRFLTAYFASQNGKKVVLTGSSRMQERPIKVLVEALRQMGGKIKYLNKEGYPPLEITGTSLSKNQVSLPANVSSQYISALILIAPSLPKGLRITLVGETTSVPYIKMSLNLLEQLGIQTHFEGNEILVPFAGEIPKKTVVVESDWSSASYYYSILALSKTGSEICLSSYKKSSLQGDSALSKLYEPFGITTAFEENSTILTKAKKGTGEIVEYDLRDTPDLAQTLAVSCFGLGIPCYLTGLHTLKIKETDRLEAMKTELSKLGAKVSVTDRTLAVEASDHIVSDVAINTYNDHRMAMAFAPLAMQTTLNIQDAGVVSKSYPDFWTDLKSLGFRITE